MRILYISHTGRVGGAEHALCDLAEALPSGLEPYAACPPGPLQRRLRRIGVPVFEIPATDAGARIHPIRTAHGLAQFVRAAAAVRRLAAKLAVDVVHANTARAGVTGVMAAALGAPRPLVLVHDSSPPGALASLTRATIARGAALIVPNSHYTARRFGTPPSDPNVQVAYCGTDTRRFDPRRVDRAALRRDLGFGDDEQVLAVVAQLTPLKGQDDAIRVLARLRPRYPKARLVLAGSPNFVGPQVRYDNAAFARQLEELAHAVGVRDAVVFSGEVDDVPRVLGAADVALVPSWEEGFGRAVTEAMAMEVPVVATAVGGPAEVVVDGEHGFLLPPRQPDGWAQAVARLLDEPDLRARMGRAGRARVEDCFSLAAYVEAMVAAYDRAASRGLVARVGLTR